jgi:hypothetical protein
MKRGQYVWMRDVLAVLWVKQVLNGFRLLWNHLS